MPIKRIVLFAAILFGATHAHAARWIVYNATQSIDCSGFANGGKLTMKGADAYCADDVSLSSATLLSASSATATYFQPANATTSNLPEGSRLYFTTARSTSAVSASAPLTYSNGVFGVDGSSVTLMGQSIPAAKVAAGSLGSSVIASSVAVASVQDAAIVGVSSSKLSGALPAVSGAALTSLTAANISAGSLGASVIASSIAANGVTAGTYGSATQVSSVTVGVDGRVTGAANVSISLTNSNLQSGTYSNVTVPAANVAAGSLGASVITSSVAVGAVQDASIVGVSSSKLSGALPAVSGASLTSLTAANISAGSLGASVIASSIAVNAVQDASIVGVSGSKITGTASIPNAAIDGSSVTKKGSVASLASLSLTASSGNTFTVNSTDLAVDSTNHRLGVGISAPEVGFVLVHSSEVFIGSGPQCYIAAFYADASVTDRPGIMLGYDPTNGGGVIAARTTANGQPIKFWTFDGSGWGERIRIDKGGAFGIYSASAIRGTITPSEAGMMVYDTLDKYVCLSTGTTNSTWVQLHSPSSACGH